jgi:spermidine/putrescine transport system substrate-binding protein
MKRAVFLIMLLFAVSFVISCGESKPVLRLFIWGEYISPEVVSDFEKEFGCVVKIDLFDSNEAMYAKLKAGADGYDIIVPSSYTAAMMNKQNML